MGGNFLFSFINGLYSIIIHSDIISDYISSGYSKEHKYKYKKIILMF